MKPRNNVSLKPFTTLRAGGCAEAFVEVFDVDALASQVVSAHLHGTALFLLGGGSNILPADAGVPGLTIRNCARRIEIDAETVVADTGCSFQELFLKVSQAGRAGLSFAVGIPGSLGGALASNAGAYRSNISEFVRRLEVVEGGVRAWVEPDWIRFSYRDSRLRDPAAVPAVVLRVEMGFPRGNPAEIYNAARESQRQRIRKQPPMASAGSFFKNVTDLELAAQLDSLPEELRAKGVVPAGYLIEAVGLKGHRNGGAMLGMRHANFILNVGGASATEIRQLAELAKARVLERFGIALEEEVLYVGRWET